LVGTRLFWRGAFVGGIFEKLLLGLKKNGDKVGGRDCKGKTGRMEEYVKVVKEILEARPKVAEEKVEEEDDVKEKEKDGKEDEVREPAAETGGE
jgi:hypothetical protein